MPKRDKGTKGQTCFEKGTKAKFKIINNIYNYNYIYYYINIIEKFLFLSIDPLLPRYLFFIRFVP